MRRLALASVALLFLVPLGASESDVIQPGDRMILNGNTQCTLSFVYDGVGDDTGRVFLSIASHCVSALGQRIDTDNFPAFGTVIFKGDAAATETDIALIEVAPAFHGAVLADMRGHPGVPTGVAYAGTTSLGDLVIHSGWGTGFDGSDTTRENRTSILQRHSATIARVEGPITPGDSGGPWALADGRALALTSKITATFSFSGTVDTLDASVHEEGATIQHVLATLDAAGLQMTLRTA